MFNGIDAVEAINDAMQSNGIQDIEQSYGPFFFHVQGAFKCILLAFQLVFIIVVEEVSIDIDFSSISNHILLLVRQFKSKSNLLPETLYLISILNIF